MGQPGLLGDLLIRNFAAATVLAVAAVPLLLVGLIVFVVGSGEASGYLTGRTTIDMVDLPLGPTKQEHIQQLTELAEDHDVSLALVVPDRSGAPSTVTAYSFAGSVAAPVFWGNVVDRPASDIGDAVIVWSYAVDGSAVQVGAFLDALRTAEFEFVDATPTVRVLAPAVIGQPGILAIVACIALGVVIAVVAESDRRDSRQRLRGLSGLSPKRIAAREALETAGLLVFCSLVVCGALAVYLLVRGASPMIWSFSVGLAGVMLPAAFVGVVGLHVVCSVVGRRRWTSLAAPVWRPTVVALCGVALVSILTVSTSVLVEQERTASELERSLRSETADGDDVVLGVGMASVADEDAFGRVALAALATGTAELAQTTFMQDALLVAGDRAEQLVGDDRDGVTVLVPESVATDIDAIADGVRESFDDGWEVDDDQAPRVVPIHTEVVGSTAPIVAAADRWIDWVLPRTTTGADVPVIVVTDVRDLPPNRLGTATRNGEVRFADRTALVQQLTDADLLDVVTQINRVGAVLERALAAVRTSRAVILAASAGTVLAILFAAATLIADHRTRHRRAARLRFLVGRHPAVQHARFVLVASGIAAGTTAVTVLVGDDGTGAGSGALLAASTAGAVGVLTAVALSVLLAATHHRERPRR
ncbi:hypothetical protein EDF23_11218 [Curtobacterium sp. PhB128]|nr:hypothetical protein EDF23_11218 [Curtobacterium sp. PhB128]TCL90873.1 hypothetical protein EDF29_11218 [Curtobacterium sp. PhB138]